MSTYAPQHIETSSLTAAVGGAVVTARHPVLAEAKGALHFFAFEGTVGLRQFITAGPWPE
jgi:hypothetical protein